MLVIICMVGRLSVSQWHAPEGSSSHAVASLFAQLQQPHTACLMLCCRQTLEDLKVAKVRQASTVPPARCTPWACLKPLLTHCSRKPVAADLDCPSATLSRNMGHLAANLHVSMVWWLPRSGLFVARPLFRALGPGWMAEAPVLSDAPDSQQA